MSLEGESLLVVVATYNEIANLPSLVESLRTVAPGADVLVVDDNSPDGTGKWATEQSLADSKVHCIVRSGKLGLGSATLQGFQFALASTYRLVATMDADLSHAPASLIEMLKLLQRSPGAQQHRPVGVVIGSRYVAGGRIIGWPLSRRVASKLTNWATRLLLRLPTRDNTSAFRVYRREALEAIGLDRTIRATGYGYLEELLFRLHREGFEMLELPICFTDRMGGKSKASIPEGFRVIGNLLRLAFSRQ